MNGERVLIVEDDETIRLGLAEALNGQGLVVKLARDGFEGERAIQKGGFDLVILDLMLPGPSGLDLLRKLRATDAATSVLILTAKGDEIDKVLGLELGADDYMTKPFGLRELIARLGALLRRRERPKKSSEVFTLGDVQIDLAAYRVKRTDGEHGLSPREAGILALLYANAGQAVSRNQLLDEIWGSGCYVTNRTIDTHVLNLRQKIEADSKAPTYLTTVHGVGYRLTLKPPSRNS
jgi:DNA-binding response OmpR family regulator